MPLKGRQIEAWIEWSGQQIHLLQQQSQNVQYRRNFACLSLNRLTDLRTPWTTSTPSRRYWAFNSLMTKYSVPLSPPLSKELREWFMKLPTSSIDNFEQLGNAFLHHFVGGQRPRRPADHLLTSRQGEKETLRSYVKRFTRETLEVDEVDDKMQLTTFKAELKSREFVVSLVKNPPLRQ